MTNYRILYLYNCAVGKGVRGTIKYFFFVRYQVFKMFRFLILSPDRT
jgi:hypothetical protein